MNSKTLRKIKESVDHQSSDELVREVDSVTMIDPVETTRNDVLAFVSKRFKNIEEDRKLKKLVSDRLYNLLENEDTELSVNQLVGIYKTLGEDETASVDSLLQMLKPVPNAPNPWTERKSMEEFEKEKAFKNLEGKDFQALEKFDKFLEIMSNRLGEKEE